MINKSKKKFSKLAPLIRASAYAREAKVAYVGKNNISIQAKNWVLTGQGKALALVEDCDIINALSSINLGDIKEFTREDINIYLEYLLSL